MKPQNIEEKVVFYYLIGIYVWYFLGAQYILSPVIALFLTLYLVRKLWNQTEDTPDEEKVIIPSGIWVWIISMLIMEFALIMAHVDFELGVVKIITSSTFWFREWALLALFPLSGCLNIRPQLIYRAVCINCLQTLVVIPIAYLAMALHVPELFYRSQLRFIGGASEGHYYEVGLYFSDLETGVTRLRLFAPWAPALGLIANIYFFLACQESDKKWRWIGMIGAVIMGWVSVSRLAIVCLPTVTLLTLVLMNFARPIVQITAGVVSFLAGIFAPVLINYMETLREQFNRARASSSEVRDILGRIALDRWWNEAPIWGHGIVDEGGPVVAGSMPIGTHHTWFGLLFIRGLVGYLAFAVPFLWSFLDLLNKAHKFKIAKVGLSLLLVLFIFSFGENIETLSYMYWPGLVIMGIAFKSNVYKMLPKT